MQHFKNLTECITYFQDERTCWDYFEKMRWEGSPVCPHCGSTQVYRLSNYKQFKCGNKATCDKKFTALVGTMFENTKIPLQKWFAALYLCTAHKKGISSIQLAKDLGLTQKTGWFLFQRIREMMLNGMGITLRNVVQVDETYIKGKRSNKSKRIRKLIAEGKMEDKESIVLGMIETGKSVVFKHVTSAEADSLAPVIKATVPDEGAIIVTDGHQSYVEIGTTYSSHMVVNHSIEEYVNEQGFTTNSIENAFSLLKRGIYGIYHHVSGKHLQRYCNEFSYRFNNRSIKDYERFTLTMEKKQLEGRLTYKRLIAKNA